MNKIISLMLFLGAQMVVAQTEFREQLWLGLSIKKTWENNIQLNLDGGFRSFDHFTRQARTALGRVSIEKKWNKGHSVAVGYASFNQLDGGIRPEHRLFAFYKFVYTAKSAEIGFRFGNELRFYPQSDLLRNRSRLQVFYRYQKLHRLFQPALISEFFLTPGKSFLHEERLNFSVYSKWSGQVTTQFFFLLQSQSFVSGPQHIIGFNLHYTLP